MSTFQIEVLACRIRSVGWSFAQSDDTLPGWSLSRTDERTNRQSVVGLIWVGLVGDLGLVGWYWLELVLVGQDKEHGWQHWWHAAS